MTSKDVAQGPWWTPTAEVERMMRECQSSLSDTWTLDIKVLEGLLHDSLLWRQDRLRQPVETKPPLGQEPWRLSLPVITVKMLADYGQEGFFEKTDQPVQGVIGVSWSSAAVDFACMLQGRLQERLAVEPT